MTIEALPSFLDIDDPSRNLAGPGVIFPTPQTETWPPLTDAPHGVTFARGDVLQGAFDVPQAIPTPARKLYRAHDGTPIGYGNTCDPITDEMQLSGLDGFDGMDGYGEDLIPSALKDNRVTWLEDFALPLLLGVGKYMQTRSVPVALGWAAGAYMAPYPLAAFVAYRAYADQGDGYAGRSMSLPPPPRRLPTRRPRRSSQRVNVRVR
jgi:hypothetical protein